MGVDIHSHLIPGIDDGVTSLENSLEVILLLQDAGYKKVITTPHIISDTYKNTPDIILSGLKNLTDYLEQKGSKMKVEAAAEYYLDTWLINEVNTGNPLLTFGDKFFLFEMNYVTEPYQLNDFIFSLTTKGYKPVLAHPERYQFMTLEKAEDLRYRGVLLQINILSLIGFYSRPVQLMAHKLIDKGLIDFLGSDSHGLKHAMLIKEAQKNKYFAKAMNLPLYNHTL
ncbi:MAG TPA: CpsB/CapC family capsule biosynthesis tyrosine phosphatase [Cyclobacteriaceae bacterium]|nr:CpsB/CapC family capsule biosynthesis tyrosine phosphatase [Cyclobacteriaceae bacterium]